MKRLVTFRFDPNGKWATLSGVLLGIAFFVQSVDFLLLQNLPSVSVWKLFVMMILPMMLEAAWCVSLRVLRLDRAEVYGIFGAAFALVLLLQAFFWQGMFQVILLIILLLLSGATMVIITWGFFGHRALGALIFLLTCGLRLMFVLLHRHGASWNWLGLLSDLPSVCMLLSMAVFFGNLKKEALF